jgi:5-methylcytosine-specific restriction protein A
MGLATLKPRLATADMRTVKVMAASNPQATQRIRGSRWMKMRQAALIAGEFTCVDCGAVSMRHEIDHETPLELGGSNEDDNLKVRCYACHKAKSKDEATGRAQRAS